MERQQRGFTLIELMIVVAIIAILAAIAISQYGDYLIRAQVSEGSSLADGTKTAVVEYYSNHGYFGAQNASIGLVAPLSITGRYLTQLDAGSGVIKVTFGGGNANAKIIGQTLSYSPIVNGGSLEWICNPSSALDVKYVPSVCRN